MLACTKSNPPFRAEGQMSANPFGHSLESNCRGDVLVIEDDVQMSLVLEKQLRQNGFHSVAVFTGEEALAVLKVRSFAIILLDCRLPGCDGFEVLRGMRARDD